MVLVKIPFSLLWPYCRQGARYGERESFESCTARHGHLNLVCPQYVFFCERAFACLPVFSWTCKTMMRFQKHRRRLRSLYSNALEHRKHSRLELFPRCAVGALCEQSIESLSTWAPWMPRMDRQHTLDKPCCQLWLRTKSLYFAPINHK